MPFHCNVQFEPTHIGAPLSEATHVERWLVAPDEILEGGAPIARLSIAGAASELQIRFRCQVGKLGVKPGVVLKPGDLLLRVYADGEEIPSGFRYCSTHAL